MRPQTIIVTTLALMALTALACSEFDECASDDDCETGQRCVQNSTGWVESSYCTGSVGAASSDTAEDPNDTAPNDTLDDTTTQSETSDCSAQCQPSIPGATCAADGVTVCSLACPEGRDDCDGNQQNGCEADLTDPQTCGSCSNSCGNSTGGPVGPTCDDGACAMGCIDGWVDLNGDPSNCEVRLDVDGSTLVTTDTSTVQASARASAGSVYIVDDALHYAPDTAVDSPLSTPVQGASELALAAQGGAGIDFAVTSSPDGVVSIYRLSLTNPPTLLQADPAPVGRVFSLTNRGNTSSQLDLFVHDYRKVQRVQLVPSPICASEADVCVDPELMTDSGIPLIDAERSSVSLVLPNASRLLLLSVGEEYQAFNIALALTRIEIGTPPIAPADQMVSEGGLMAALHTNGDIVVYIAGGFPVDFQVARRIEAGSLPSPATGIAAIGGGRFAIATESAIHIFSINSGEDLIVPVTLPVSDPLEGDLDFEGGRLLVRHGSGVSSIAVESP